MHRAGCRNGPDMLSVCCWVASATPEILILALGYDYEQEANAGEVHVPKIFINLLVPNQQTGAIIGKGMCQI